MHVVYTYFSPVPRWKRTRAGVPGYGWPTMRDLLRARWFLEGSLAVVPPHWLIMACLHETKRRKESRKKIKKEGN